MKYHRNFVITGIGSAAAVITVISGCTNFLEQFGQARQAEAQQNIKAINRAQRVYFSQKNSFSSNLSDLGVFITSGTENYSYSINLIGASGVQAIAIPQKDGLRSLTSGTFGIKDATTNQSITIAALCESEQPSKALPPPPQLIDKEIQCPSGFRKLESQ